MYDTLRIKLIGAAALLLLALPAAAYTPNPEEEYPLPRIPTAEIQKLIRTRLEAVLPAWDKRLLLTYETPKPWEDNLQYGLLNKLLGETPFEWEGRLQPPPEADRLTDAAKSMRIRRADGDFRYHSRKRVFTPDLKGKAVPPPDNVARQVQGILGGLEFPLAEAGRPDVQVQETALGDDEGKVTERFPIYAFFLLERKIEGVPVEGSTVRAAVNARGEVQRLKISWPHFKVRPGTGLRTRERVLEEAFQKVAAQDPTEKLELVSRLVYTRTAKGDYLPAVQVDVSDGETPYRLTIPVAE